MSFILEDNENEAKKFFISSWAWKMILKMLSFIEKFDKEKIKKLDIIGESIDERESKDFGIYLSSRFLEKMKQGDRITGDLKITFEKDDGTFHLPGSKNYNKNFTIDYKLLTDFCVFALNAKGFTIY